MADIEETVVPISDGPVEAKLPYKVFVGIPVRLYDGPIEPEVLKCLDWAAEYGLSKGLYEILPVKWGGMSVTQNSYELIKIFLNKHPDCTHFLYTGDDLTFAPDAIEKLLLADKPVISACSTWKTPPFFPNADALDAEGLESKLYVTREMVLNGSIIEVKGAGSGMMLIQRKVLEDVRDFWWQYFEDFNKLMPEKYRGMCPVPFFPVLYEPWLATFRSTDFSFCEVAKKAGHTIWWHCGVIIGHIWRTQFSILDHFSWRENFGLAQKMPVFPTQKVDFVKYTASGKKGYEPGYHGKTKEINGKGTASGVVDTAVAA